MDLFVHLAKARAARQAKLTTQLYVLSWRGGGVSQITGQQACADHLQMRLATFRVYLSKGHGSFDLQRTNPTTGEMDILTVIKVSSQAKATNKRGRPKKYFAQTAEFAETTTMDTVRRRKYKADQPKSRKVRPKRPKPKS